MITLILKVAFSETSNGYLQVATPASSRFVGVRTSIDLAPEGVAVVCNGDNEIRLYDWLAGLTDLGRVIHNGPMYVDIEESPVGPGEVYLSLDLTNLSTAGAQVTLDIPGVELIFLTMGPNDQFNIMLKKQGSAQAICVAGKKAGC
jgi:hypothetical protein